MEKTSVNFDQREKKHELFWGTHKPETASKAKSAEDFETRYLKNCKRIIRGKRVFDGHHRGFRVFSYMRYYFIISTIAYPNL